MILLKSAAAVASSAVMATVPSPSSVFPATTDAAAVNVFSFATVVVAVPRLPVKVTSAATVAVTVVALIVLKSASSSASIAVIATVPLPPIVLP